MKGILIIENDKEIRKERQTHGKDREEDRQLKITHGKERKKDR